MSKQSGYRTLPILDTSTPHSFATPTKRLNDGEQDLPFFHTSYAYADIMTFIMQLNIAMFPQKPSSPPSPPTSFPLIGGSPPADLSPTVRGLYGLVSRLHQMVSDFPPDPGPRRFGNISFRRWYEKVTEECAALLDEFLPAKVLNFPADPASAALPCDELQAYLLGSFGSAQRLDYGTGHELSFLAFLGAIWKLGGFETAAEPGVEERKIVVWVVQLYLVLVRHVIITYNLEPAGSHGVWGLDDHSFIPYIFGSAQLAPPIPPLSSEFKPEQVPQEGSLQGAPLPSDVTRAAAVRREQDGNMYFSAVGFIYDVKKGPFWEHSPVLYDVSGITTGWAKVNKGMLKMYNVEVLSKFPVVQHFPFGSLFRWETDPSAPPPPSSVHSSNQPTRKAGGQPGMGPPAGLMSRNPLAGRATVNPDIGPTSAIRAGGAATRMPVPRFGAMQAQQMPMERNIQRFDAPQVPARSTSGADTQAMGFTQAPWARPGAGAQATKPPAEMPATKAPWADGSLPKR